MPPRLRLIPTGPARTVAEEAAADPAMHGVFTEPSPTQPDWTRIVVVQAGAGIIAHGEAPTERVTPQFLTGMHLYFLGAPAQGDGAARMGEKAG